MPITHPAAQQGEHIPIGIFGDDAKYTLAGAKVIVMLLNIVIQTTMRFLAKNINMHKDQALNYSISILISI